MHINNISQKAASFILHKRFHPGNYKNMEKVWLAEQRVAEDARREEEVQQKRAQEIRVKELRKQHESSTNTINPKIQWVYAQEDLFKSREHENATAPSAAGTKVSETENPVQGPGSRETRYVLEEPNRYGSVSKTDTLRKLREDPLVAITKAQILRERLAEPKNKKTLTLATQRSDHDRTLQRPQWDTGLQNDDFLYVPVAEKNAKDRRNRDPTVVLPPRYPKDDRELWDLLSGDEGDSQVDSEANHNQNLRHPSIRTTSYAPNRQNRENNERSRIEARGPYRNSCVDSKQVKERDPDESWTDFAANREAGNPSRRRERHQADDCESSGDSDLGPTRAMRKRMKQRQQEQAPNKLPTRDAVNSEVIEQRDMTLTDMIEMGRSLEEQRKCRLARIQLFERERKEAEALKSAVPPAALSLVGDVNKALLENYDRSAALRAKEHAARELDDTKWFEGGR